MPPRDLEDKVHDVFLVFFRRIGDFDISRPIRPYLAGIAVRIASEYRRSAYQRHERIGEVAEAPDDSPGPESALVDKEARDLVLAALDRLDADQRVVFVLHDIEGHSIPELGEVLGSSVNTLYSRLRQAREHFAKATERHRLHGGKT